MGLFSRKQRLLPHDVAGMMAAAGKRDWERRNGAPIDFSMGPDFEFSLAVGNMTPAEQRAVIDALADAIIPVGGWAVWGAWKFADSHRIHDGDPVVGFDRLLDASLELQRRAGITLMSLSIEGKMRWEAQNPGATWLAPRAQPTTDQASLRPLAAGEERHIATLSAHEDANRLLATRTDEGRYLAVMDLPVERDEPSRGRTRHAADSAADLHALYSVVGRSLPLSPHWAADDFEPFLIFPMERPLA